MSLGLLASMGVLVSAMNRLGEGSHRCVEDDMV